MSRSIDTVGPTRVVASRRPISARDTAWARQLAVWLGRGGGVTPNQISLAGVGFAALASAALVLSGVAAWPSRIALLAVTMAAIQLRLPVLHRGHEHSGQGLESRDPRPRGSARSPQQSGLLGATVLPLHPPLHGMSQAHAPWRPVPRPGPPPTPAPSGDRLARIVRPGLNRALRAFLCRAFGFRVHGTGEIPCSGPFVVVANHSSHSDAPALVAGLPLGRVNDTCVLAAADYFFRGGPLRLVVRLLVNAVPVDRQAPADVALAPALELLAAGRGLIVFPEGTRSESGQIGRFRQGVGMLLAGRRCPAIPAYITGARDVLPKRRTWPRRAPLSVVFGKAVSYAGEVDSLEGWRRIAGDLEQRVRVLSHAARQRPGAPPG